MGERKLEEHLDIIRIMKTLGKMQASLAVMMAEMNDPDIIDRISKLYVHKKTIWLESQEHDRKDRAKELSKYHIPFDFLEREIGFVADMKAKIYKT